MTAAILDLSAQLRAELTRNEQDTTTKPVRNHAIKAMSKSAAHAKHAILTEFEPKLAQRIGLGAHSLLLGGPPVLLCPTKTRKSKAYDAWRATQPADAIVLSRKEYERANRINEAVRADKLASQVLFVPGTVYEETINWEQLGRARRCTPDARTRDHLVDLKTTRDASPDRFKWDVARYGYALQLADYRAAMEHANGFRPLRCYIVAVESVPPYAVTVHLLTQGTLERSARQCVDLLGQIIACERANNWPGYGSQIFDLDIADPNMELVFDDEQDDAEGDE